MAKKRKSINQDDAKARQRKASKASGMKLRYNVGPTGEKGMTGYVFGGGLSNATGSEWWTSTAAKNSVRVDAASPEAAMRYLTSRSLANIPKSQKAAAAFRASEKKKSNRATANKKTKRRER
jgi:hypothetical protein